MIEGEVQAIEKDYGEGVNDIVDICTWGFLHRGKTYGPPEEGDPQMLIVEVPAGTYSLRDAVSIEIIKKDKLGKEQE